MTSGANIDHSRASSICDNSLELIILPTEQCNFRCTYCYETFENKKMPAAVVAGIKALIDHRCLDLDLLKVSWFGGEPLLAMDVVEDISRHAIERSRKHGFVYASGATTNGYFLDPINFKKCIDSEIRSYQISLDGDKEVHDRSRKLGSKAGTFDKIWQNLLSMKSSSEKFNVLIRLHYQADTYESMALFSKKVHDVFGGDKRFQIFFKAIERLGGNNDKDIQTLSSTKKFEIESYLWAASGFEKPAALQERYICYAAKGNSLVIRSTGRIAKCTVALESDFNDIGSLNENGFIEANQKHFARWIAPVIESRWEDAECPLPSVAAQVERDQQSRVISPRAAGVRTIFAQ
jgi:uncharacterized protein